MRSSKLRRLDVIQKRQYFGDFGYHFWMAEILANDRQNILNYNSIEAAHSRCITVSLNMNGNRLPVFQVDCSFDRGGSQV